MRIIAVLNSQSGTLRTTDMDAFIADAVAVFKMHGHDMVCVQTDGAGIERALQQAAENKDFDVLLAGGGDGTISAAAALAWEYNKILAVLPVGTMNLFARSLNIPQNINTAVEALAQSAIHKVDIGLCNRQVFVHQVAIGLHPMLVLQRETYDYGSRAGKIWANIRSMGLVIKNVPRIKTEALIDGREIKGVFSAIAVSNNPYGDSALPVAPDIQTGRLGFYLAQPLPARGMVKLLFDVLRGKWRNNLAIAEEHAKSVQLQFFHQKRHKYMLLDGELLPLPMKLDIQIHAGVLRVMAPLTAIANKATF